jgi:acyl transferase domain-containing protein
MTDPKSAVLFPGQGAFAGGALKEVADKYPQISQTLAEIDAVADKQLHVSLSETLLGSAPPTIEGLLKSSPEVLQLAIYGTSVAVYRILGTYGFRPTVLIGHSFGEIAALVCGGAFSARDGAEIVCHRVKALSSLGERSGYMAALGTNVARATQMLDLLGVRRTAVAVENEDRQTVVSGEEKEMDSVGEMARVLQIPFVRLYTPYPFHSPVLEPVVADFASRLRQVAQKPLHAPVYSPILGRYYQDSDRLTDHLVEHLTHPVRFSAAIRAVHAEGISQFVECGALETLSGIVKRILSTAEISAVPCLVPGPGGLRTLESAIETLTGRVVGERPVSQDLGELLPSGTDAATVGAFWAARGETVRSFVQSEFAAFRAARGGPAPKPVATPPPASSSASPAPATAPSAKGEAKRSRADVLSELITMYATALEYPEEVFTETVALEAELGVDSVKQAELFGRVADHYGLPPRGDDFRLAEYDTLGKVADSVFAHIRALPSPV